MHIQGDVETNGHATSSATALTPNCAPGTVVPMTLNEAHNMDAALQNLNACAQEVFLCGNTSSDETISIAPRHGVHMLQRAFCGFGNQWNFALHELPNAAPWTMKLDPGEWLTGELQLPTTDLIRNDSAVAGISVKRRLWFIGTALPVRQSLLRDWRNGTCQFPNVTLSEYSLVPGPIRKAQGNVEHHDSPDLQCRLNKENKHTAAGAVARYQGTSLSTQPNQFGALLQRRMWLKRYFVHLPIRYSLLLRYNYLILDAWQVGWGGYPWSHLRCEVYHLIDYKAQEVRLNGKLSVQRSNEPGSPDPRVQDYS